MLDWNQYILFIGIIFIIAFAPGPNVFLMVNNGILYPLKRALSAVPGVALGLLTYALVVSLGLAHLIVNSPKIYLFLKILGASYLIYLGFKTLTASFRKSNTSSCLSKNMQTKISKRHIFIQGYLCCLANPKVFAIYLSILPQFIDNHLPSMPQFLILSFTHVMITTLSMCTYCITASKAQIFIKKYKRIQTGITGLCMIALGLSILAVHHTNKEFQKQIKNDICNLPLNFVDFTSKHA